MGTMFWIVGAGLALLVVFAGLTGYSLEKYGQKMRERRITALVHKLREERLKLAEMHRKLQDERRRTPRR